MKEFRNLQDSSPRRSSLKTRSQVFSLIKWLISIMADQKDSGTSSRIEITTTVWWAVVSKVTARKDSWWSMVYHVDSFSITPTVWMTSLNSRIDLTKMERWFNSLDLETHGVSQSGRMPGPTRVKRDKSINKTSMHTSIAYLQMSNMTQRLMMVLSSCTMTTGRTISAVCSSTLISQKIGLVFVSSQHGPKQTVVAFLLHI